jgi:hypothetical protein
VLCERKRRPSRFGAPSGCPSDFCQVPSVRSGVLGALQAISSSSAGSLALAPPRRPDDRARRAAQHLDFWSRMTLR